MNPLRRLLANDELNFVLTNRVPRIALTRLMGRFSKLRNPWLARCTIAVWRVFTDLDLSDAREQRFASLHDCFTRRLKPGARPIAIDRDVLVSPCDAIVGACGRVDDGLLFQAKGLSYRIEDLFGPTQDPSAFRSGLYVTLRLTSSMYHRFHAPHDLEVEHVSYLSGDTWNVNPPTLARIERLYCRNERAVVRARLAAGRQPIALVPVAAILVASIRLHWLDVLLHLRYRGPNEMPGRATFAKGDEMGWFEHGSTIIVFAPPGFSLCEGIATGARIRMGTPLIAIDPEG